MNNIARMAVYLAVTTVLLVLITISYVLSMNSQIQYGNLLLAVGIIVSLFQVVILGEIIWSAAQKKAGRESFAKNDRNN